MQSLVPHLLTKEVLTRKEAQSFLGISKPTFYRWRKRGLLNVAKVAGRVYVRRQDLVDLVDAHMEGATAT